MDGLKPSQRKALFACFKRKLTKEIKVAQVVGYVSEHTAYHHGEQSMEQTVVKLAQDFVGSNNINLLFPGGQFGSRLMGGKDAASSRYIFTRLAEITRTIFPVADDDVLDYLDDEGTQIEPKYYVPIVRGVFPSNTFENIVCITDQDRLKTIVKPRTHQHQNSNTGTACADQRM